MTLDNDRIIEDLASIKTSLDHYNREFNFRVSKLESDRELVQRQVVISEQQSEMIKSQQVQNEKIVTTLSEVNINLTKLNMGHIELNNDVKSIASRVEEIEDKGVLNVDEIIKKYIVWIIGLPMTVIGAWLLFKFGL